MSFKICEFINPNLEMCGKYIYNDQCYCIDHSFAFKENNTFVCTPPLKAGATLGRTCCLCVRQMSFFVKYIFEKYLT